MSETQPFVVVFTGGTSGIGLETIKAQLATPLPRRPWHIIVGSRSTYDGFKGLQRSSPLDRVTDLPLDLARYESVRAFVRDLVAGGAVSSGIDCVVLCAGVVCGSARITEDGQEETLQVNALSQALLLDLLWPMLRTDSNCRVVFVASALHSKAAASGRIMPASIDQYPLRPRWKGMDAYADSKLLFMHIFFIAMDRASQLRSSASQSNPLTVVAVSPGFIPTTRLVRELCFCKRLAMSYLVPLLPFTRTPGQGGALVAKAVLDLELPSGVYISRKGEVPAAKECYDSQLRKEWEAVLEEKKVWLQGQNDHS